MKYLLPLVLLVLSTAQLTAQRNYDDLLELVVDEKYERCLQKCFKYMDGEDTKKDPMPYLYASMSYYRIHQSDDPKLEERFPKAFKNSLKYLVKHRKKDKQDEFFAEHQEFISEVRLETMLEAEREVEQEKFTRSKGLYKYLTQIDVNDPGAWMALAHSFYMMKSRKDAGLAWDEAKKILNEQGVDHLAEEQLELLKQTVIRNAEMLDELGERGQAKEWLEMTQEYFADDKEFSVVYRTIVG
ncbi:MAG: hypothetical protein MK081_07825 [Flavobacteriales bacterium]|nr:hypothetical protein [Flavobacteriales bacterium]